MNLFVEGEVVEKYGLSEAQFFLLMALRYKHSSDSLSELLGRSLINTCLRPDNPLDYYFITRNGENIIQEIIADSIRLPKEQDLSLDELVKKLQEVFPKGKKEGTFTYWRGNSVDVKNKLKNFFKKYGKFPHDLVLEATIKYVDSFGGNTQLMRSLPYFIGKNNESDLLTIIENIHEVEDHNTDWTHTMV